MSIRRNETWFSFLLSKNWPQHGLLLMAVKFMQQIWNTFSMKLNIPTGVDGQAPIVWRTWRIWMRYLIINLVFSRLFDSAKHWDAFQTVLDSQLSIFMFEEGDSMRSNEELYITWLTYNARQCSWNDSQKQMHHRVDSKFWRMLGLFRVDWDCILSGGRLDVRAHSLSVWAHVVDVRVLRQSSGPNHIGSLFAATDVTCHFPKTSLLPSSLHHRASFLLFSLLVVASNKSYSTCFDKHGSFQWCG